jgi:hypothetical protein
MAVIVITHVNLNIGIDGPLLSTRCMPWEVIQNNGLPKPIKHVLALKTNMLKCQGSNQPIEIASLKY